MRKLLQLAILLSLASPLWAQGVRYDNIAMTMKNTAYGTVAVPAAGVYIAVCSQPASISATPCSPKITIYSDVALTKVINNPTTTDVKGNYYFYYNPTAGPLTIQVYGATITTYSMADQNGSFPTSSIQNVINAAAQTGDSFDQKVAAAQAVSGAAEVDARGLCGAQTLSSNLVLTMPITFCSSMVLSRVPGAQIFQNGPKSNIIGNYATITGNDSTAAIRAYAGVNNPGFVKNLTIQNLGLGTCVDYITQGVVSTEVSGNVFECATGVALTGYYNKIHDNQFTSNIASPSIGWAGLMLDTAPGASPNDNWEWNNSLNLYNGTGVYFVNGYTLHNPSADTCEWAALCAYIGGTGYIGDVPYNESATANHADNWAANTQYGRGAVVNPGNGWYYICVADGMSGSSAPTWATVEAGTTTDNTVTWKTFSGVSSYNHRNGVMGGDVSVVLAGGFNQLRGGGMQHPTINDQRQSAGYYDNDINTVGNLGWGTPGFKPFQLPVDYERGIRFLNAGATDSASLNFSNATYSGNYTTEFGLQFDNDNCSGNSGQCGHAPLRIAGLYASDGINVLGPAVVSQLPDPDAPTLSNSGASGSTSYTYYVVAHSTRLGNTDTGVTLPSSAATITDAPATLDANNCVNIQVPSLLYSGAGNPFSYDVWSMMTWDILKGDTSHSLFTQGRAANGIFKDCGGATSAYTPPTRNTTGDTLVGGYLKVAGGTNVVYRCLTAGAVLPTGTLTIDASACGSSQDTGLRVY